MNTLIRYGKTNLKTILAITLMAISTLDASAQKDVVVNAFKKYGLDQSILDPMNLRLPTDRTFELKESTTTAGKTKVLIANFNPAASGREQWKVVSVDGKTPSLYESNTFRNAREKPTVDKAVETSFKIESETADNLVISYKLDAASIPKDAGFLKDCRASLTIDLKTKELQQQQIINEKPVKIGPLTADRFQITTNYSFDKISKRYLPLKDALNMEAKFLGRAVTTQVETVYSNYSNAR
ncbi:hypothetical protein [Mucilaginibacter myungsuensis]|uniref:Uncharacterized protein n=1 Tax=Mucilaginibacter myungsuensis TaxID=649104 RepID=A0A929PXD9_9SPHI|nr:hypothetical protein [Mucilaginibacter myungsuensis]MBE9663064.1 hypothetical protein [Mucilaginibacter myungsuensis]MDN3598698.1 hypothetical protein [Mucilaginibacter myungsuensis]